eukprot:scaffold70365_cov29-Tisochrysis_lutea.AAC.1
MQLPLLPLRPPRTPVLFWWLEGGVGGWRRPPGLPAARAAARELPRVRWRATDARPSLRSDSSCLTRGAPPAFVESASQSRVGSGGRGSSGSRSTE